MNEIPEIGMDSKNNDGIHLWIKGTYVENLGTRGHSISVHLTRNQLFLLIMELIRRFVEGAK